jgi:hypothetical protein
VLSEILRDYVFSVFTIRVLRVGMVFLSIEHLHFKLSASKRDKSVVSRHIKKTSGTLKGECNKNDND